MNTRVGLIGLGSMGSGIAHNLLRKGFTLTVYARKPEAAQPFLDAGARRAHTPAALARDSDIVILSLNDAAAVEEVLFGPHGVAHGLAPGGVVVDTSTIAAESARAFGERLRQQGLAMLDAPVSGGQQGAAAGTLGCMVGGDADVLERCREVLQAFCKAITHVGALGAGQTVKACNQVAVAGALLGVADALALAQAQGVDPMLMRDVLLGGTARSFPLEKHAERVINGDFQPGFRAQLMRKDLRIALETARSRGTELHAAPVAERLLDALCESGNPDTDWIRIAKP